MCFSQLIKKNFMLLIILLSFNLVSCAGNDKESLLVKPSAQELEETKLSNSFLECLRGNKCEEDLQIKTKNIELRKLINFNQLWENYPGSEYSLTDVKELIGGMINSDWIHNSCTIRLSRALNYSNNNISKWGFENYAGQWGNPGLLLKGDDNLHYAIRVREMAKYLLKFYSLRPIHLSKSQMVRNSLTNTQNLYSDENIAETEELENRLKATGKKGILMFNVALWSDATGHFEVWNNEESKGHSRFLEAQEVFLWVIEENDCNNSNMHYEEEMNLCVCNNDYTEIETGVCSKITCPEFSTWDTDSKACTCQDGYKMNNNETACQKLLAIQANTSINVTADDEGNWSQESSNYTSWHINPTLTGKFNCRVQAGTNNEVLTTLSPSENFSSLKEFDYDNNNKIWFKVITITGVTCFLRARNTYIKPSLFAQSADNSGDWEVETALYKNWRVTDQINSLNCRAGAGTNNEILTSLGNHEYISSLNTYKYDNDNNIWFEFKTDDNINCFVRARSRYIEPIEY